MKYISFDPGKNTGVVCWNENGEPIRIEEMRQEALDEFLDTVGEETKVFIIEEYRVYPHVRHPGSLFVSCRGVRSAGILCFQLAAIFGD